MCSSKTREYFTIQSSIRQTWNWKIVKLINMYQEHEHIPIYNVTLILMTKIGIVKKFMKKWSTKNSYPKLKTPSNPYQLHTNWWFSCIAFLSSTSSRNNDNLHTPLDVYVIFGHLCLKRLIFHIFAKGQIRKI